MIKNNNLVLVTNNELVEVLKGECQGSNITFLFPVKDFCVGMPCFEIKEIKELIILKSY